MIRAAALTLAAFTTLAGLSPAQAQSADGDYTATIRCTAFPGTDIGAFAQQMSFRIAKGAITGERNVGTSTQVGASGVVERWTGSVSPEGTISANSNSASARAPIQGVFNGRGIRDGFDLRGTQAITLRTGARAERSCTVAAKR